MSIGEFGKAKEQLDILIDKSGYSLMEEPFGTFFEGGESASWYCPQCYLGFTSSGEQVDCCQQRSDYGYAQPGSS